MATRNLTKKFVELRSAARLARTTDESDGGLLQENWKTSKSTLPPAWVDTMEKVEEDTSKITRLMKDLSALHSKRLMVNFETDETAQEMEIESKTRQVTEVFHHAEALLKKFSKATEQQANFTPAERTVRKNMQMAMAKRLQTLSMNFRSSQRAYLKSLQAQKNGSGAQAFDFLSEQKKAPSDFVDNGFNSEQLAVLEDMEGLVNERDAEITKIAKNIEELAQIFKELAVLVIDQGTILDRIDYNMETAVEHVKVGLVELQKAEEHQKNSFSTKCIILLILLIIVFMSILIWKHSGN